MYIDRTCREYQAGAYAYADGLRVRHNPYLRCDSPTQWDHWTHGYLDAQQARADARPALPVNRATKRGASEIRKPLGAGRLPCSPRRPVPAIEVTCGAAGSVWLGDGL